MGVVASAASKQLSHSISFAITLAIVTNIAQMVFWSRTARSGTTWEIFGPFALTLLAIPLVMVDLTRHVLQDGNIVKAYMYRDGCPHADVRCLSLIGWSCLLSTYVGFACLITGVLWNSNIIPKVMSAVSRRRRAHARTSLTTE